MNTRVILMCVFMEFMTRQKRFGFGCRYLKSICDVQPENSDVKVKKNIIFFLTSLLYTAKCATFDYQIVHDSYDIIWY